ncbi:amino acid adenylation domain-containing protein [Jatrophihabitans sp. DSM 44399]|uniref:Amino acid adenylation domain-containing protein n=1 Tax=Jatrophihabitans lederbergiae TaxID=3075547 RepID=A0ABU2JG09_9ACTN|nr:amino acid adenylation domain-containing protein [Jatrophihabitans sp. DSM 44399]
MVERPDASAIASGPTALTYRELWQASGRYRDWLHRNGVRPGDLIAIEVGRRIDTICALVGALRAGAIYLPLSDAWPEERCRQLTHAAGVDIVCSDAMTAARLLPAASRSPAEGGDATDLIYVLYTSGTTGTPKGVAISDANVCSMLDAALGHFDLSPCDVWAMSHLATFDFSVWEMWGALTTGGRIELLTDDEVMLPRRLRARLAASRVSILSQVPSSFSSALKEHRIALQENEYPNLRYVVFGGERVTMRDVSEIVTLSQGRVMPINMYGITEGSVHATFCALTGNRVQEWIDSHETPIGFPLLSHQVALGGARFDDDGSEVGELMLAGPAVSRGYWRDDELNSSRFARDPAEPSTTWFKTGDIVRRFPSGELAYIERRDSQVKVMGYRIDQSEVERHALRLDGMTACAAYVTRQGNRDRLALAYVSESGVTPAVIADHLRRDLPTYMIPSVIHRLDTLPVTESGKVDRTRLSHGTSLTPQGQLCN